MCVDLKSCEDVGIVAGKELRLAQWSHRALGTGVPRGLLTCQLASQVASWPFMWQELTS